MNMTPLNGSNKIVVVGGGAAGMMAAGMAAQAGAHVTLLEQNGRPGKKLLITGKGRCNVTNDCAWQDVLQNVPTNPRFLYSALAGFSPADARAFFEQYGCALKTERGNRVFPVSDRSQSVLDALVRFLHENHVQLLPRRVTELAAAGGRVTGVKTESGPIPADCVMCNLYEGSYLMTKYFLEHGRKKIYFIGGEPEAVFTKLRLRGYIDAHRQCGAEFSSSWIYNIFPDSDYADRRTNYAKMNISSHYSGGFSVVGRMLDDMPDAIETVNDEVAMGILSGLKTRGVRVPEDVWLAGYDDTQYVSMLETPLTTIRQPVYDMAEKTVSVLLDRIRDPDAPMRIHYIDPILKLRSTSR